MKHIPALLAAIAVSACAPEDDGAASAPGTVRVGVLPDQSVAGLSARYEPLVAYLENATGLDLELFIPTSYEVLLDEFDAGRLRIANFGGVTFAQAEERSGAVPLVMRDVDLRFVSCYLVRAEDPRRSIRDFEGETFSFGPELSTSGHVMPRYFLTAGGVVPEHFFGSLLYSAGHDQTAAWVDDGTVAAGVANCDIVQSMFEDGRLTADTVRVLDTTPPYSNYVWATQPSLDDSVRMRVQDAFLALDPVRSRDAELLHSQGAGGYLPASRDDFDDVRAAALAVGLIEPRTGS